MTEAQRLLNVADDDHLLSHRTWPVPARPWRMRMRWHDLLFAHWPIPLNQLQPLIPDRLNIDTWDGQAWIGIVPFRMSGVGLRGFPNVPGLSAFPELNVRTYVTVDDKPGVWFFSLDATNPVAVRTARWLFHLPYRDARIRTRRHDQVVDYQSHHGAGQIQSRFDARYWPSSEIWTSTPDTLDHWLTARYCLYTADRAGHVYRGEIDHAPWPLQHAELEIGTNQMTQAWGIQLPAEKPILHFARELDVVAWTLDLI